VPFYYKKLLSTITKDTLGDRHAEKSSYSDTDSNVGYLQTVQAEWHYQRTMALHMLSI
jgi:hypothetical protein